MREEELEISLKVIKNPIFMFSSIILIAAKSVSFRAKSNRNQTRLFHWRVLNDMGIHLTFLRSGRSVDYLFTRSVSSFTLIHFHNEMERTNREIKWRIRSRDCFRRHACISARFQIKFHKRVCAVTDQHSDIHNQSRL